MRKIKKSKNFDLEKFKKIWGKAIRKYFESPEGKEMANKIWGFAIRHAKSKAYTLKKYKEPPVL